MTPTSVVIGSHQPLSGPEAVGYDEIAPAATAYFQYVNDHGGVHGRRIEYRPVDDQSVPSNAIGDVRQLLDQSDGVFAIFNGFGTPTHQAVRDLLTTRRVPDLFVGSGCPCWNDVKAAPYTFGFQPDDAVEGTVQGHYIVTHFAGRTVGYLLPVSGAAAATAGLDRQIPAPLVVARQTYDPSSTTMKAQVAALQHAGADVIVADTVPVGTALALLAAAEANYHPTWVVANAGADVTTVTGLLQNLSKGIAGGSLLEGVITDAYLAPVGDPANGWTQLWRRVHDAYAPKLPLDGYVAYGMAAAYTFVQALDAAGANPTRDGIVHALETSHLTGPGLTPFGYSAVSHAGYTGVQMGTIVTGRFVGDGPPLGVGPTGVPVAVAVAPPGP